MKYLLEKSHCVYFLLITKIKVSKAYLLGCSVGTCWASLSSFNMCKSVVLPALSNPKNRSFPDFFHKPAKKLI